MLFFSFDYPTTANRWNRRETKTKETLLKIQNQLEFNANSFHSRDKTEKIHWTPLKNDNNADIDCQKTRWHLNRLNQQLSVLTRDVCLPCTLHRSDCSLDIYPWLCSSQIHILLARRGLIGRLYYFSDPKQHRDVWNRYRNNGAIYLSR